MLALGRDDGRSGLDRIKIKNWSRGFKIRRRWVQSLLLFVIVLIERCAGDGAAGCCGLIMNSFKGNRI